MPFGKNNYIAEKDWRHAIGDWYEELTLHLLGGELQPYGSRRDLLVEDFGYIEIKGVDSNHKARYRISQLGSYRDEVTDGFPYEECAYANFFWTNQMPRHLKATRGSFLSSLEPSNHRKLDKLLAAKTNLLYLLDIDVVEAIREQLGEQDNRLPFSPDELVVEFNRTFLRERFLAAYRTCSKKEVFFSLGLNPRKYSIVEREIVTRFRKEPMRFRACCVLKRRHQRLFDELISSHPHKHARRLQPILATREEETVYA